MDDNENIYIKVQIEKDLQTKRLMLRIQFDKNAPNFSSDKNDIIWTPTEEEINFIVESFEMVTKFRKNQDMHQVNISDNRQENASIFKQKSAFNNEAFDKKKSPPAPLEIDIVSHSETTSETTIPPKEKKNEERLFVQADEKTIDEIIKKKNIDYSEALIVESNEKDAIDRVLKQKMKRK